MLIAFIIFCCLVLFGLYRIYKKLAELDDDFNAWYGDWQKKFDPYEPKEH
jgi:hypothetical protein